MIRYIRIIFSIIIFYGCISCERKQDDNKLNVKLIDTFITKTQDFCIQRDTITSMGTKIHYIMRNGKFQISWGDNSYNRVYDSLFTCDYDKITGLWDFVPKFYSETQNHLIFTNVLFTSSGTNPAPLEYYIIVCPKNKKDSIIQKDFFVSCLGNYLVYNDAITEYIHVLNVETNKTQTINLKPSLYISKSPTLGIKETKIKENNIYITYETRVNYDSIVAIKKVVKLKI